MQCLKNVFIHVSLSNFVNLASTSLSDSDFGYASLHIQVIFYVFVFMTLICQGRQRISDYRAEMWLEKALCLHDLEQTLVVALWFFGVGTIPLCPAPGTSTLCYCCLTDLHSRAPRVSQCHSPSPWQQRRLKHGLVWLDVFINQTARDRVTQRVLSFFLISFMCV